MGHETQRIPRGRGPPRGALGAPPELRFWALDAGAADAAAVAPASDSASAERPQVSHFVARFGFHCTPRHERSACLMEAGLQAAGGRGSETHPSVLGKSLAGQLGREQVWAWPASCPKGNISERGGGEDGEEVAEKIQVPIQLKPRFPWYPHSPVST